MVFVGETHGRLHIVDALGVDDAEREPCGGMAGFVCASIFTRQQACVDAIPEDVGELRGDVGYANRLRPTKRPTVIATRPKPSPIHGWSMLHHAMVAEA